MARKQVRVAACQLQAAEGEIEANAKRVLDLLEDAAGQKAEIVAFQEGVLYGYTQERAFWESLDQKRIDRAERKILKRAKDLGVALILGTSHVDDGSRYNSLLIADRDGTVRGRFGKTFAGEFWCENGKWLPIHMLANVPCCFLVCHDIRYPELVRLPSAAGAQVCFSCSCESPLTDPNSLSGHRAMPTSRATENFIYMVLANAPADPENLGRPGSSYGESRVIDPRGNIIAQGGTFTEEAVVCTLDLTKATRWIARRATSDPTRITEWLREGMKLVERPGDVRREP